MEADENGMYHVNGQEKLLHDVYRSMAEYHFEKLHAQTIFLARPKDLQ
jgi:hypothetical protein